jgi:hypothetical protein
MNFNPKSFMVQKWAIDSSVINPHLNPEIEYYSLQVEESLGAVPIVGTSNKRPEIYLIGISWVCFMTNMANNKTILTYEADDEYIVSDFSYDGYRLLANASHKRLSEEFDKRKAGTGLAETLSPLDISLIDHLYHDTIDLLKQKGAL